MNENERIAEETASILLAPSPENPDISLFDLRVKNPLIYKSGTRGLIYVDVRQLISYPQARNRIVELMMEKCILEGLLLAEMVIAGIETGGVPLASWIAWHQRLPLVTVPGISNDPQLFHPELEYCLIEDTLNTGRSILDGARVIRKINGTVSHASTVVTYGKRLAEENLTKENINSISLVDVSTLLEKARGDSRFDQQDLTIATTWHQKNI